MLLYIGDDIRTVWRDQKRLSEGTNRGRTDNIMTTRKKGERLTVVYETQHIILKSEQNEPYSKTGWIRICGKIVVKHNNQQIRCSRRWVVAAPYYTGNVCAAHGPGDDDHFLAVSLWMFASDILSLICNGLWHYCTARSKWYYSFNRAYADPCKIIISS